MTTTQKLSMTQLKKSIKKSKKFDKDFFNRKDNTYTWYEKSEILSYCDNKRISIPTKFRYYPYERDTFVEWMKTCVEHRISVSTFLQRYMKNKAHHWIFLYNKDIEKGSRAYNQKVKDYIKEQEIKFVTQSLNLLKVEDFDLFVSSFSFRRLFVDNQKVRYIFNVKYKPHLDKVTLEELRDKLSPITGSLLLELYALI